MRVLDYFRRNAAGWALALIAVALGLAFPGGALGQIAVALGPVAGATATFDMTEGMKVVFEDTLETNVVSDSELLDAIEKDTNIQTETGSDGRYIERAHLFGLPAGYGYRKEGDPIPVPRGPVIRNARIYLKKSMGTVSITGDMFEKVKQGKAAFVTWARQQFPSLVRRMVSEKDRIMLGYGMGVKARVASIDAGAKTITVASSCGVNGLGNAILQFLANEDLAFAPNINGTGLRLNGAGGHNVVLLNVDWKTGRLFLSEIPVGLAVNDYIFSCDEHGVSSVDAGGDPREFMGLLGHIDDGSIVLDYFDIARDEHSAWQSIVVDGSGAPYNGVFSEDLILEGDRQARIYGGAKIDMIVAPDSGCLQFWRDLKNDRQLNDPRSWTGGHGRLYIRIRDRVVEIRGARKLPGEIAFGITKGTFKRYTLGKFMWVNRTGSMWQQVIKDGKRYDAFWSYGVDFDEIFCKEPNQNIRWKGLDPTK